jgi:LPPG:FO 2-phospho-L-lactate transferase
MSMDASTPVVVLAGGTGGAKLARGLYELVGDRLIVIANTGDDVEIYSAHVSPDPDLCTFWLADRIDERGWGLHGDTFHVMDGLRELGEDIWFNLGDRDLAIGLHRAQRLAAGVRLTETLAELTAALGVTARVLPMADTPVRTVVVSDGRDLPFQEFMIGERAAAPIGDVRFDGAATATATPEVVEAIAAAGAIIIGPSNPIISIDPILAVPGLADALRAARAPVVAVSPLVGGAVLKGPTAAFLQWAGVAATAAGVADHYGDLVHGMVTDEPGASRDALAWHRTDTEMGDAAARVRLARETLTFCETLA